MFYVGIDWAKESHQVHITDDSGKALSEFKVTNNHEGLHKLLEILRELSPDTSDIFIGIETNSGILFEFLLDNGYTIYPLNPSIVDKFRSRYKISRTKTDPIDAMTIANILRTDRHHYRPALADSPLCRKIRLLARDRKSLMEEKTKIQLQLQECLKLYYPLALQLFYCTDSKKFIDFIKENPSLEDARKRSLDELRVFLRKHYTSPSEAEKVYEKIHSPQIEISPFITEAKKRYSLTLVDLFENILNQIKAYDKEIAMLVEQHPYSSIFLSLPGVKHNLGSRLLGEIGDNLSQYKDYNSLQSYAGTAPVSAFPDPLFYFCAGRPRFTAGAGFCRHRSGLAGNGGSTRRSHCPQRSPEGERRAVQPRRLGHRPAGFELRASQELLRKFRRLRRRVQ